MFSRVHAALIVTDSYMAMILPDDLPKRISEFIAGKTSFPFLGRDELMCLMYVYGKQGKVKSKAEADEAAGLAQRTAAQLGQDIDIYVNSSAGKLDPEYIRSRYINRHLQLAVEKKDELAERGLTDPVVVSDCFAQHAAYYRQDYFFELYGPLKDNELVSDVRQALAGRIIMVCCNRKSAQDTGLSHPLIPVYVWFRDQAGAKP